MKKGLLFATLLCSSISFGQSLTQANEPAIGATQVMYLCDSFATSYDAVTGAGVTWDYSTINAYAGQTRNVTMENATATTNAASFPSSVKALTVENTITTYFSSTATERVSQGFVFNEPSFGDVIATFTTDEAKVVEYPFANGNSLNDAFSGNLDFTFNGVPQTTAATGNAYAWIDGQGTLKLPNATDYTDVIRYKLIDTSNTNILLFGDLEIVRTQYEYYDIANNSLPVFAHSHIVIQQPGGGAPLADQTVVLSSIAPMTFVGLEENSTISFNAYPNPAEDQLTVTGSFETATAEIIDQSGRIVHTEIISNGATINLSALNTGMYMLKVSNNGTSTTKSIVKR